MASAGPIASFMCGPGGVIAGSALACALAWSASELLGARDRIKATLVGAGLALVMPFLVGDLILRLLAGANDQHDAGLLGLCMPVLVSVITSAGFAILGVLAWCRFEASD